MQGTKPLLHTAPCPLPTTLSRGAPATAAPTALPRRLKTRRQAYRVPGPLTEFVAASGAEPASASISPNFCRSLPHTKNTSGTNQPRKLAIPAQRAGDRASFCVQSSHMQVHGRQRAVSIRWHDDGYSRVAVCHSSGCGSGGIGTGIVSDSGGWFRGWHGMGGWIVSEAIPGADGHPHLVLGPMERRGKADDITRHHTPVHHTNASSS